ncbi:hypothetical protein WM11_09895 [Burkholderia ubonensis]|nr:hypothetical protein WK82_00805 [Burkholderia ubonensis]KVW22513.1 hypothetical protein WK92_13605 [Burkholderia ubonensis]KWE68142.1 hypothetical protein WL78_18330 [Burkholderia ubonensis]KWI94058.1 hypothetical protein WM10_11630 [Burkholderia ubonensis]KWK02514.1 hypothetical protein WM12_29490 [Burkholderia ubonensis]
MRRGRAMRAVAPASRTAARVLAIRDGRDDRLLVLCGIAAPGLLPLETGRWLRALRAEYEDELELLPFVRAPLGAGDADRLLQRCARLHLPAAAIADAATTAYGRWRARLPAPPLVWRLLDAAPAPLAAPPGGLLVRWPSRVGESVDWPRSRRVVADLGAASPALGVRIGALADALCAGTLVVAGVALDALATAPPPSCTPPTRHASHTFVADALDQLANCVRIQRIAAVTRRAPSLRSRL